MPGHATRAEQPMFLVNFGPTPPADGGFDPSVSTLAVFKRPDGNLLIEEWECTHHPATAAPHVKVTTIHADVDRHAFATRMCGEPDADIEALDAAMCSLEVQSHAELLNNIGSSCHDSHDNSPVYGKAAEWWPQSAEVAFAKSLAEHSR